MLINSSELPQIWTGTGPEPGQTRTSDGSWFRLPVASLFGGRAVFSDEVIFGKFDTRSSRRAKSGNIVYKWGLLNTVFVIGSSITLSLAFA